MRSSTHPHHMLLIDMHTAAKQFLKGTERAAGPHLVEQSNLDVKQTLRRFQRADGARCRLSVTATGKVPNTQPRRCQRRSATPQTYASLYRRAHARMRTTFFFLTCGWACIGACAKDVGSHDRCVNSDIGAAADVLENASILACIRGINIAYV